MSWRVGLKSDLWLVPLYRYVAACGIKIRSLTCSPLQICHGVWDYNHTSRLFPFTDMSWRVGLKSDLWLVPLYRYVVACGTKIKSLTCSPLQICRGVWDYNHTSHLFPFTDMSWRVGLKSNLSLVPIYRYVMACGIKIKPLTCSHLQICHGVWD